MILPSDISLRQRGETVNDIYYKTLPDFKKYSRPRYLDEAISILAGQGAGTMILAGGTDVLIWMRQRDMEPENILDITGIENLNYIEHDENRSIRIGALVTIGDIQRSKEIYKSIPILHEAASKMSNVQINNLATVVGNVCRASPSADMACALLALDARVSIVGANSRKEVTLADFIIGTGKTILNDTEIVNEIIVPQPRPSTGMVFLRSTRSDADLAQVNIAVTLTLESEKCTDVRMVLGSVGPKLLRLEKIENILKGQSIETDLLDEMAKIASDEINPREGSLRASVYYKRRMTQALTKQAILTACEQSRKEVS
jgi:aerobic carbon-monoxide dehydrogenase medium subunit